MKKELQKLAFLNFFLSDVRDGVGPYLAIFLLASHHWEQGNIGTVMSAMGISTIIFQSFAGSVVDRSKKKLTILILAAIIISVSCIGMIIKTTFFTIMAGQILLGIAAAFIPIALNGITLGLVGEEKFKNQLGKNEGYNHAGNVFAAVLAGLIGYYIAREGIFILVAFFGCITVFIALSMDGSKIDDDLAKGISEEKEKPGKNVLKLVFQNKNLLILFVSCILFHFANAAMLPLLGQVLSLGKETGASLYMSACIIVAQLIMIPVSFWVGKSHDNLMKKLFLAAFIMLTLRGVLYTLTANEYLLVGIQILDGLAAGIFGIVSITILAKITKGSGVFNLMQGILATAVGIGASASHAVTGFIAEFYSYHIAFLFLAAVAAIGFFTFIFFSEQQNVEDPLPKFEAE